jgi:hypothetical protein
MRQSTHDRRRATRRRTALVDSILLGGIEPPSARSREADEPEWRTERWKHAVEAEARNRLKREIHDVAR